MKKYMLIKKLNVHFRRKYMVIKKLNLHFRKT